MKSKKDRRPEPFEGKLQNESVASKGAGIFTGPARVTPNNELHADRGRILFSRNTTPLQRPRRVNSTVRLKRCGVELDSQVIEILGRQRLIAELLRDGLEVAVPVRDRGVDLIAYADLSQQVARFASRPIQMKAA